MLIELSSVCNGEFIQAANTQLKIILYANLRINRQNREEYP